MMKRFFLHIILGSVLCMLCFACSNHEEPAVEDTATVVLDFNLSSRATAISNLPGDFMLWAYEENKTAPVFFKHYRSAIWEKKSVTGEEQVEYVTHVREKVPVKRKFTNLRVHAVINPSSVKAVTTQFSSNLTETELGNLIFQRTPDMQTLPDSRQLMYGTDTVPELSLDKNHEINLQTKRCVAKVELYVTQRNDLVGLKVMQVELQNVPEMGYLVPHVTLGSELFIGQGVQNVFKDSLGRAIQTVLPVEVPVADFDDAYDKDPNTFTPIPISAPYIVERYGADSSSGSGGKTVELQHSYILNISYTTNQKPVTTPFAFHLPTVERNTIYRVFIRVKNNIGVEVNTVAIPWEYGKGDGVIDITPPSDDIGSPL